MSKFVGKFRKHKEYRDDNNFAKDYLNNKRVRSEHGEIKRKLLEKDLAHEHDDLYDDDDYEDQTA